MKRQHRFFAPADDANAAPAFCPNCGQPVKPDDVFCGNCGFDLRTVNQTQQQDQGGQAPDANVPSVANNQPAAPDDTGNLPPRQPQPARHNGVPAWVWILIVILIVVLGGGYFWGNSYFSKTSTLNRTIDDLKAGRNYSQDFTSADPSFKINSQTMAPLQKYLTNNNQALAQFKAQLGAAGTTEDSKFTYRQNGNQWLIFPKYQVAVTPVYPTVTTNHQGATIKQDDQQVAKSNSDHYSKKLGPLVPGQYKLASTGTISGHDMVNSATYHINSNNDNIDLQLKTISFKVAVAPSSEVYLNGKKQGTVNSSGVMSFDDQPWSDNMRISAQYPTKSATIKTKEVKLATSDDQNTIKLDYPGMVSDSDAQDFVDGLFQAVSGVTGSGDTSDATDSDNRSLDEYFVGGTDDQNYQDLLKMAKGYHDDDDILSVTYDAKVNTVTPAANNTCSITYDLKYDFAHEDDDHIQTFRYTIVVQKNGDSKYQIKNMSGATKVDDYTKDNDD